MPALYSSCKKFNAKYPHGVGRVGARDKVRPGNEPVTTFKRSNAIFAKAMSYNPGSIATRTKSPARRSSSGRRLRNVCVECGRERREGERGWRAYLTVDDEVAVYCPSCAEREFGRSVGGPTITEEP
jgi:hypothetical protein